MVQLDWSWIRHAEKRTVWLNKQRSTAPIVEKATRSPPGESVADRSPGIGPGAKWLHATEVGEGPTMRVRVPLCQFLSSGIDTAIGGSDVRETWINAGKA
jgi:hypothetical protein